MTNYHTNDLDLLKFLNKAKEVNKPYDPEDFHHEIDDLEDFSWDEMYDA